MKRSFTLIRKKRILQAISMVCILTLSSVAYSQIERSLKFIPEKVDFGTVREEDGKVSQTVKAVNISPDTTFIISARTSCGCSAVEYSDDKLAPGDTTEVTVTYDPVNRPGRFLKTAKFFTGKERIGNSIKLSGNVIPSKKNLDKTYPEKVGSLRLSALLINAGDVSRKDARPLFVGLYNDSDAALALTATTDAEALEAGIAPDTIGSYGVATLTLMLKGRNIPANETEILYKAHILNSATSDTLLSIPVIATVK